MSRHIEDRIKATMAQILHALTDQNGRYPSAAMEGVSKKQERRQNAEDKQGWEVLASPACNKY